jgi:hypothetical protein
VVFWTFDAIEELAQMIGVSSALPVDLARFLSCLAARIRALCASIQE